MKSLCKPHFRWNWLENKPVLVGWRHKFTLQYLDLKNGRVIWPEWAR